MVFRALVIAVSLGFTSLVSGGALAQAPVAALAGFVSSPESGAMEESPGQRWQNRGVDHGHSGDRQ